MSIEGYFYLHENGDLIYKRELDGETIADLRESDFVKGIWPMDPGSRMDAWQVLVEALAAGAKRDRVLALSKKWGCTNEDGMVYAEKADFFLSLDGDQWCATRKDFINIQQSPAGFGPTVLEAAADLCRKIGVRPGKMWNKSFHDALKENIREKAGPRSSQ